MTKVIDNAKCKFLFVFIILSMSLYVLTVTNQFDFVSALRMFYGGFPLYRTQNKVVFVIFCILVQYINSDIIIYYLKNVIYLRNRYRKINLVIYSIIGKVGVLNVIFVGTALVSSIAGSIISCEAPAVDNWTEMAVITGRGLLMVIFFSLVQILLLLRTTQTNAFIWLTLIALTFSFLSETLIARFTLMPLQLQGMNLFMNVSTSVLIIASLTVAVVSRYRKTKENCHDYRIEADD
jgi:hypothetical protein